MNQQTFSVFRKKSKSKKQDDNINTIPELEYQHIKLLTKELDQYMTRKIKITGQKQKEVYKNLEYLSISIIEHIDAKSTIATMKTNAYNLTSMLYPYSMYKNHRPIKFDKMSQSNIFQSQIRSEERRVGKEC